MLRVLTCLGTQHDARLLLIAVLICLAGTITAIRLHATARDASSGLRLTLVLFTGITAGASVWATHFIAMLAYDPGLNDTGYEPIGTIMSLVVAAVAFTLSFGMPSSADTRWPRVARGMLFGGGAATMHFLGMSALRTGGVVVWDETLVAASILIGCSISVAAFMVIKDGRSRSRQLWGGALLTLAACGLHFTAMGAASIRPDPSIVVPAQAWSVTFMTVGVAGISVVIIITGLGTILLASRSRQAVQSKLLEAIPQGLAFYDADDRCLIWNTHYALMCSKWSHLLKPGVTFETLLRESVQQKTYPEAEGREAAWILERLALRATGNADHEQKLADGRWLRIEERRTPDGGMISVCVDITSLKDTAEQLETAVRKAEAATKAKGDFLANMSHELRTPLNGVLGISHVLSTTRLTKKQLGLVGIIEASAKSLERLLSDVLDLARMESGGFQVSVETFDLREGIFAVCQLFQAEAAAKGLILRTEISSDAAVHVQGDPVRLRQILINLLNNAVKFTEKGTVTLRLWIEDHSSASPVFVFDVADTGIGFDAEVKARLFSRFEQADATITRRFGGTGLGLAISRDLACLMGGSLRAESEPGRGSVFTLRLPMRVVAGVPEIAGYGGAAGSGRNALSTPARSIKVLLAEDHPVNRQVVQLILGALDVDLTCVENGLEAVEASMAGDFDIILMDMQMPVMDGLTAIRLIRTREQETRSPRTPIIVLSANAMADHIEGSALSGADGHLTKPINAEILLQTVSQSIERLPNDLAILAAG